MGGSSHLPTHFEMIRSSDFAEGASLTLNAPAKVNLFLEVTAKRADGYHDIDTVMMAITLFDQVKLVRAAELTLTCSDPALSRGPDNLAYRAAEELRSTAGIQVGAEIHLTKQIPMQAGLAGGSSDAATTLLGLNRLWNLNFNHEKLTEVAAKIGSDVAFFLKGATARCQGRGEIVKPVRFVRPLYFVIVCPQEGLSTADVYRRVQVPSPPRSADAICQALASGDLEAIGRELFNRLEEPAMSLSPMIREIKEVVARFNPIGCLMSGSGSSLFALCAKAEEAQRLAQQLRTALPGDPTPRVFVVQTCSDAVS